MTIEDRVNQLLGRPVKIKEDDINLGLQRPYYDFDGMDAQGHRISFDRGNEYIS